MVLDRRWATPLIGDAVCNCLIGCAESSSTTLYSLLSTHFNKSFPFSAFRFPFIFLPLRDKLCQNED